MDGAAVRRAVHDAGGDGGLLHELLDAGGVGERGVLDGEQNAVRVGAEPHPVQGGRPVADGGGQVAAGQGEGDGASGVAGGEGGEDHVRARGALGAEAAADVGGGDGDPVLGQAEDLGEGGADGGAALAGVVHREVAVLPGGGGGVRLHRVVVQRRHVVGGVDADRRGVEGAGGVAAFADRRVAAVGLLGYVPLPVVAGEGDVVRPGVVVDAYGLGTGPGRLQGLGHHEGDEPAPVRDVVVLEDVEGRVVGRGAGRGVPGGEDVDHAGQRERGGGVHRADAPGGDDGGHGPGVEAAGRGELGGVPRGTGDLVPAFPARNARPQFRGGVGHLSGSLGGATAGSGRAGRCGPGRGRGRS